VLKLKIMPRSVLSSLYGSTILASLALAPVAVQAQTAPAITTDAVVPSVSVVGSRRVGAASSTDTPVAIDFIPMTKAAEQSGQFDLAQVLSNLSPSFNSTRQTGADGRSSSTTA